MAGAALSPQPPELPVGGLKRADVNALAHDDAYAETELAGVDLSDQHASGVKLDTVKLFNVELGDSRLQDLRVANSRLTGCNMANVQAGRANFARVSIEASRLTGIALTEAALRDVTLRDCRVDLASFGSSAWRGSPSRTACWPRPTSSRLDWSPCAFTAVT